MEFVINWVMPTLAALPVLAFVFVWGVVYGRGTVEREPCNRRHADEVK